MIILAGVGNTYFLFRIILQKVKELSLIRFYFLGKKKVSLEYIFA
jgi:hypothetical protein